MQRILFIGLVVDTGLISDDYIDPTTMSLAGTERSCPTNRAPYTAGSRVR